MDIPEEIEILRNDIVWARHYLNQYKKLYLHNQSRIDLLNEVAPNFFRDIQRILWDEMIISVAKLADPHTQKRNRNLSLRILSELAKENNWEFGFELDNLINEAIEKAKPIIKRRMKHTAHRDLPTALGQATLEKVNINEIDEVLILAGKALNLVYQKLSNYMWSWDLVSGHDANELVYYLKLAVISKDLQKEEKDWKKESELWNNSRYFNA